MVVSELQTEQCEGTLIHWHAARRELPLSSSNPRNKITMSRCSKLFQELTKNAYPLILFVAIITLFTSLITISSDSKPCIEFANRSHTSYYDSK